MKNALVIAAREFEEKRFVAYAAVAFAVLPLVLGAIPKVAGKSPRDAIAILPFMTAAGFTAVLAVMTGASLLGRDLSEGRMSFYFSRPVGSMSIWFGKLTAGILMIAGCFGLIIAPAWFARGGAWTSFWTFSLAEGTLWGLVIALALFLLAHVISTFARSRSPLIAADFAAAVICGVSIRFLVLPLIRGFAFTMVVSLLIALAIALAVAIIGGGAWQLKEGRTDRRRNHWALSQFLWSTMAVALIVAAGFVAWVVSAKPSDLTGRRGASYVAGSPFLAMWGQTRNRGDYSAGFLIDVSDGSTRRIDPRSSGAVHFTRDGSSIVLPRIENHSADLVLYKRGMAEPVETGLTIPATDRFFLSDDGNRIATIGRDDILSIYDVAQKRSLLSVRVPHDERGMYRLYFLTPDLVRPYVQSRDGMSIYELDVRTHELKATTSIAAASFLDSSLDPARSRMLVRRHDLDDITLNDARSGAVIKPVAAAVTKNLRLSRFLRDGRVAIIEQLGSKTTLHVLSPDGAPVRDIPLDSVAVERVSYLGDDGIRLVLLTRRQADGSPQSLVSVNLDQGVVERIERGPFAWAMTGSYWENRSSIQPLREAFYGDAAGNIVAWNPATGAKRTITGG
jgi:hypothetical protein